MNSQAKSNSLQTYQLVLYRRVLHPELFQLRGRRAIVSQGIDFEAWVMPGAHVLRFQTQGMSAVELVTDQSTGLPTEGAITNFLCAGERDFEYFFEKCKLNYVATVQTEQLSENLYAATYQEMLEFAEETEGLLHRWTDSEGGRCLSLLDLQRMNREIHAQSYHLLAHGGLVLRTQTIFELL